MPNRATLIRSLMTLQSEERTGVLSIDADDDRVALFLRQGVLVYASGIPPRVPVGQRLVHQGAITAEDHAKVLERMSKGKTLEPQVDFCEAGLALGLLTPQIVWRALGDHVRRTLLRTFQSTSVTWKFEDATPQDVQKIEHAGRFEMNVEALVLEAMRPIERSHLAAELERMMDSEVVLQSTAADLASRFRLTPQEAAFLGALANVETLRGLLRTPEAGAVDPLPILVALTTCQALRRTSSSARSFPATSAAPGSARSIPIAAPAPDSARSIPVAMSAMPSGGPPTGAGMGGAAGVASTGYPGPQASRSPPASPQSFPARGPSGAPQSTRAMPTTPQAFPAARPTSGAPPSTRSIPTTPQAFPAAPLAGGSIPAGRTGASPIPGRPTTPISARPPTDLTRTGPPSNRSLPVGPASSRPQPAAPRSGPPSTRSIPVSPTSMAPGRRSPVPSRAPGATGSGSMPRITPTNLQRPTTDPYASSMRPTAPAGGLRPPAMTPIPPESQRNLMASQPPVEDQDTANHVFITGVELARQSLWAKAAAEFARIVAFFPDSDPVRLYARWSAIQARPNEPPTRNERTDCAKWALTSIKADADFAFGYYVAGSLSLLDNDVAQAQKLLSRAVKLDPNLLDATRLLRVVERRTSEKPASKGIFGRKLW